MAEFKDIRSFLGRVRRRLGLSSLVEGLAFFLLLPLMKRTLTISLDTDWFWRVVLFRLGVWLMDVGAKLREQLVGGLGQLGASIKNLADRIFGAGDGDARPGLLARSSPIGTTALWIAVLLSAYVIVYYF